jgi:uncharacterized protein (TIGR03435 family)
MVLSRLPDIGRLVVNQTGIEGNYDLVLEYAPDQSQAAVFKRPEDGKPEVASALPPEPSGPSVFTALQEQLGLKLESIKAPVDVIVIDHIERPSEN